MAQATELKEKLFNRFPNGYQVMEDAALAACNDYAKGYMAFLDKNRTERECAVFAQKLLLENGFQPVDEQRNAPYQAGDKIYKIQRNKAVIAAVIGKQPLSAGVKIAAAHIELSRIAATSASSPRAVNVCPYKSLTFPQINIIIYLLS